MRILFRFSRDQEWKKGTGYRQVLVSNGERIEGWQVRVSEDQLPEAITWDYVGYFFPEGEIEVLDYYTGQFLSEIPATLVEAAAEAQARFGDDALERFAESYWKTPEGIAWAKAHGLEYILEDKGK